MNLEYETIDYSKLYEIGNNLFNYTIQIKERLNTIDGYIQSLNDEKLWNSKVRNSILDKYMNERKNFDLLYQKLIYYSNYILQIVQSSEEFAKNATKMIESINKITLWPI